MDLCIIILPINVFCPWICKLQESNGYYIKNEYIIFNPICYISNLYIIKKFE